MNATARGCQSACGADGDILPQNARPGASNQAGKTRVVLCEEIPPLIGDITMKRIVTTSAIVGALLLGLGTTAYALTGKFNNECTMGLASHKIVHTDCSVNGSYKGHTYCFGNEAAKKQFFKNPSANLAKAETFYKKHPG
jgi:YHS domain-containing protein